MSIKSVWQKSIFCFTITSGPLEGIKLLFYTILLVFYSRFFGQLLRSDTKIHSLQLKTPSGPLQIKLRFQDISIFYEIFHNRVYTIPDQRKITGDVIDAGAHIGLASLFFWIYYFPDSRYYCIEPSAENARILEYNTRLLDRKIIRKGLSDYNGHGSFDTRGYAHNYKLDPRNDAGHPIEVCTLDHLIDSYGIEKIGLLKIDIEGEEKRVLSENPRWLNKVELFVMELHNDNEKEEWVRHFNTLNLLNSAGESIVMFCQADQPDLLSSFDNLCVE